ncbi:hypothetical protein HBB16_19115 [Pseudonocardia sp. MCCB 268]|nr:hypothetical protein [Pseudonocardia cytotoxica]
MVRALARGSPGAARRSTPSPGFIETEMTATLPARDLAGRLPPGQLAQAGRSCRWTSPRPSAGSATPRSGG